MKQHGSALTIAIVTIGVLIGAITAFFSSNQKNNPASPTAKYLQSPITTYNTTHSVPPLTTTPTPPIRTSFTAYQPDRNNMTCNLQVKIMSGQSSINPTACRVMFSATGENSKNVTFSIFENKNGMPQYKQLVVSGQYKNGSAENISGYLKTNSPGDELNQLRVSGTSSVAGDIAPYTVALDLLLSDGTKMKISGTMPQIGDNPFFPIP